MAKRKLQRELYDFALKNVTLPQNEELSRL